MDSGTRQVTTDDGVRLHVRVDGPDEAPAVLLSNSLGTDLAIWNGLAAHLAGRVRLIRYDARGHGQSSPPTEAESSISRLGSDVLQIMDSLGVESVRYCGLSVGGMIGMWLGSHAPERVSRLALCNTSSFAGNPDLWNQRIARVRDGGMAAIADETIQRWFTDGFRSRAPAEVEKVRRMLMATSVEGYCACGAAIRDMDQRGDLSRIGAPSLVVIGAHDPATSSAMGEAIASAVAGARTVTLDAAHISNIESPVEFNDVVGTFLTEEQAG